MESKDISHRDFNSVNNNLNIYEGTKQTAPKTKVGTLSLLVFADQAHRAKDTIVEKGLGERVVKCLDDHKSTQPAGTFEKFLDKLGNALMGRGFVTTNKYLQQVRSEFESAAGGVKLQPSLPAEPKLSSGELYAKSLLSITYSRPEMFIKEIKDKSLSADEGPIQALRANIKNAVKELDLSWLNTKTESNLSLKEEFNSFARAILDSGDEKTIKAFEEGVLERDDVFEFWGGLEENSVPYFADLEQRIRERKFPR